MPEIIIIAGPNGAGKTSFANKFLPFAPDLAYVNADEIARELIDTVLSSAQRDIRAGRLMLERIDALIQARAELMFETTLATLTYAARIPAWRALGYHVTLAYLRLPNVEASIGRVARRVAAGGHDIPEPIIRRRFTRSLECLETRYKPIVDEWYIYDSLEGDFRLAESGKAP
ncbi:MAG: zeta toxin family protein [Terricaulis sp.]